MAPGGGLALGTLLGSLTAYLGADRLVQAPANPVAEVLWLVFRTQVAAAWSGSGIPLPEAA